MEKFLQKLVTEGGAIVSSNECSEMEISYAQANDRFLVVTGGYGFVLRPKLWLDSREFAFKDAYSRRGLSAFDAISDRNESMESTSEGVNNG